ncbi:hypothetical protein [Rhizomicrobium electricum]|jgi:hypothetical protein|uniref:Uncharacterized protein n=1 Tax=Rhizomicrobium electricum TaxID=480070 RepID=A0ABN1EE61_9PROT|nr:hypothetical protein [Rhizomicrobium electricum]NIJ48749.1 hypothetical protein [Rhizomicrobium electricum]
MRFVSIASLAAVAIALVGVPAAAESAPDTILRICKSEDLLMHAKSFKITPDYLAAICPCIVDQVKAKAKPAEQQALAAALQQPPEQRKKSMMNGKDRNLAMGTRAFLEGQMVCAKKFPPKK